MALARNYCEEAVKLDVLFGKRGVDFFQLREIPGANAPGIMWQLAQGAASAEKALKALEKNEYGFIDMSIMLGQVQQTIKLMSTAISAYQGFKGKFLLTEEAAVWRAHRARKMEAQRNRPSCRHRESRRLAKSHSYRAGAQIARHAALWPLRGAAWASAVTDVFAAARRKANKQPGWNAAVTLHWIG